MSVEVSVYVRATSFERPAFDFAAPCRGKSCPDDIWSLFCAAFDAGLDRSCARGKSRNVSRKRPEITNLNHQ